MLLRRLKNASFRPPPKSTQVYFTCGSLSIWTVPGGEILAHINFLFSRKIFTHLYLNRECGSSLNTREKKVDMGDNLSPKHCPNRKTSASEIHVCRFGGG